MPKGKGRDTADATATVAAISDALPAVLSGPGEQPLFPEDVRAMLPKHPDGSPRFTREWVLDHVAPNRRRKMGRWVYWLRQDVEAWYGRWVRDALTGDEIPAKRRRRRVA